jgi:uncharacterized protein
MTTTSSSIVSTAIEQQERMLGVLIGVTKPDAAILESKRPVSIGEYVILSVSQQGRGVGARRETKLVLGLVEKSQIVSDALSTDNVRNWQEAFENTELAAMNHRDKSYRGQIRIIGFLDNLIHGKTVLPSVPADPGTPVYEAANEDLIPFFAPDEKRWLTTGSLLRNEKVNVKIDINKVYSRHLAVLAMTGMGKSNLISLLAKEITKLNSTMIIFDYHGDYSLLDIRGGSSGDNNKINHVKAKINPRLLSADKLADVIDIRDRADKQMHVLREALDDDVRIKSKTNDEFWSKLRLSLEGIAESSKAYRQEAQRVIDKVEDAKRKYRDILDASSSVGNPLNYIKDGRINVVDLSEFTERQGNAAMSFYLEELLDERKKATREKQQLKPPPKDRSYTEPLFKKPVLAVIEEAHVFIPKLENTDTKYIASRIAREGRKFGLGLVIVSQRPRGIDVNILSQMGSFAVMKMIQRDDQMQIASASESLSQDLIEQLTSLNPGEAIFSGQWVNIPAFVKVEEVKERKIGVDINAVV